MPPAAMPPNNLPARLTNIASTTCRGSTQRDCLNFLKTYTTGGWRIRRTVNQARHTRRYDNDDIRRGIERMRETLQIDYSSRRSQYSGRYAAGVITAFPNRTGILFKGYILTR